MRMNEAKLIDFVPASIIHDKTIKGLCAAADVIIRKLENELPKANLFENLHLFTDKELDIIAEAEEIPWYDTSYEKAVKIDIIHDYEKFAMIIGTKEAIEGVTTNIFGESYIDEWYEYGGQQYGFKVHTQALLTPDMNDIFTRVIEHVKNMRSNVESIAVNRDTSQTIYAGVEQYSTTHPEPIIDGYRETESASADDGKAGVEQYSATYPEPIIDGYKDEEMAAVDSEKTGAEQYGSWVAPAIK